MRLRPCELGETIKARCSDERRLVAALIGSCLQCQPHACSLADAAQGLAVDRDFFLTGFRGQREPRFCVRRDGDFEMQRAVRFFPCNRNGAEFRDYHAVGFEEVA